MKPTDFETEVLRPALAEVCESRRLLADYTARVIELGETDIDAPTGQLVETLAALAANSDRQPGPTLVLADRERQPDWPDIAGRYAMTPMYAVDGDRVYASPTVCFWMRFNANLHGFNHRYDPEIARHPLEDVTRAHILNHVLASFDFYKIFANARERPPGF